MSKPPSKTNVEGAASKDPLWSKPHLRELANPIRVGEGDQVTQEDLAYVKDARVLIRRRLAGGLQGWLPWMAVLLVGTLVFWASWAELEEVTRGEGKVIPSKSVQVIQSLEGGIIEEINVEEGQVVEKDQPLLRIRDAIFASTYKENSEKCEVLDARLCRLRAESEGYSSLNFPAETRKDLAELERSLFEKRKQDHETTKHSLQVRLTLAQKETELLLDGTKSRAVSAVELIRAQKELEQIDGQLRTLDTASQREAMENFHKDKAERDGLIQAILRDKDRLDRTLIRAPVRGTINKISIKTVGRVVGSGVDIMEIVPADDTLLIEANVRPADIAFIHPGQEAMVKFTAYDFSIYGGLKGTLEHISADTITNEKQESFYQIKVRTQQHSLGKYQNGKELEIIPGMVAEVDILTGKKTVLTYLLKPINRARTRAFKER